MEYILHIAVIALIYSILASSLNLVAGTTGLLSLCHAALFGIGAYATAILTAAHCPWPLAALYAVCMSALLALFIGALSLRLRGDAFAVTTFACQLIVADVLRNWQAMTNGPAGIKGIASPSIFGWIVSSRGAFLVLVVITTFLVVMAIRIIVSSPFGRACRAVREDEVLTLAAGKAVYGLRLVGFGISASFAGLAGVLYAHYMTFIDPTSFTVMESIFVVSLVILGGAGSIWGPILGACLLVSLPEALRFIGLPAVAAGSLRQLLYGVALVACMLWRPQGLIGEYAFGMEAKPK